MEIISSQKFKNAGNLCLNYLLNSINEDGSFIYQINAETGVISENYNILRHIGSVYAILQCRQVFDENIKSSKSLEKALRFVKNRILPVKNDERILLCPLEKNNMKLGGAALCLLMMLENYHFFPNEEDLNLMRGLANFIVWMQEPSGKFKSKYFYLTNSFSTFNSIYYPGQAILALSQFYQIDQKDIWIKSAFKGVKYLFQNPVLNSKGLYEHNHWLVIALAYLCKCRANEDFYNELNRIIEPTVNSIIEYLYPNNKKKTNYFSSTALSTRGEAIIAIASLEAYLENFNRSNYFLNITKDILESCICMQINEQTYNNSFDILGGVKNSVTDNRIRIDFVQHLLHLLIGYCKLNSMNREGNKLK